jgi:ribonuclease HII
MKQNQDSPHIGTKPDEITRTVSMWKYEQTVSDNRGIIVGVDEVGRGCIAGPVFAAAVVLGGTADHWIGLNDSKKLSKKQRQAFYERIRANALAIGVGTASVSEIDEFNILHASRMAMGRARNHCSHIIRADVALVDGIYVPLEPSGDIPCQTVINGDALCLSIAAASIVAKVERDTYMADMSQRYPEYGFVQNAGYGTAMHLEALARHGVTPLHRQSFGPVRAVDQMRLNLA